MCGACRDHPRSRGVYCSWYRLDLRPRGSSPLARGLPGLDSPSRGEYRIIPARAGFTIACFGRPKLSPDHPRSRGVYVSDGLAAASRWGSSPLARGLLLGVGPPDAVDGIIPARAGFTSSTSRRRTTCTDHPRSRGVYGRGFSAPLERVRIIPARAGFTWAARSATRAARDHPRSRGVYRTIGGTQVDIQGSSPLARGLPRAWVRVCARVGIIPARAGFTAAAYGDGSGDRDHPRSRGVYLNHLTMFPSVPGSSPLARGLQRLSSWSLWSPRIIPARAGFTVAFRRRARVARDHPRSRGVYCGWTPLPARPIGSSPLARGLRRGIEPRCCLRRIIPARAGFTPRARLPHPRPVGSSPLARGLPPATRRDGTFTRIIPARAGFTT